MEVANSISTLCTRMSPDIQRLSVSLVHGLAQESPAEATGRSCRGARKVLGCDVFTLRTKHGSDIVAAYVPTRRHSDPTLLFSHGNAVDLGQMLPFYK